MIDLNKKNYKIWKQNKNVKQKKGGNMDTFDSYGDMEMLQMENQELDNRLKECKTEEEKQEVINEYVSSRIFAVLVAIVILILATAIVGAIIYLFKWTLWVTGISGHLFLKISPCKECDFLLYLYSFSIATNLWHIIHTISISKKQRKSDIKPEVHSNWKKFRINFI